jgi:hypothetical protein
VPTSGRTEQEVTVDDDRQLDEAIRVLLDRLGKTDAAPPPPPPGGVTTRVEQASSVVDRIKDNIAYIVGLPATLGGAFGFLWDTSGDEAALQHQVDRLEEAVADLKAEGDLLGGGTKNFTIDMSGAPGGSLTVILVAAAIAVGVGLLVVYQRRRRR